MQLVWDDQAWTDLDEIWNYIAKDNVVAAQRVFQRLHSAVSLLSGNPLLGRMGRVAGTRGFVYSDLPYIAVYAVREAQDIVVILRIIHTAQRYPRQS